MTDINSINNASNIINKLPIELWNIILEFTPHTNSKDFIMLVTLYNIFTPDEFEELKKKYI